MKTRFAPSPTGPLHLGHLYSALMCQHLSREGRLLLRFEDIDHTRVREEYYTTISDDLDWFEIGFDSISRQSQRLHLYAQALDYLIAKEYVYPCFCTRKELRETQSSLQAPHEQSALYNGKCRILSLEERSEKKNSTLLHAWRLDTEKVAPLLEGYSFRDTKCGVVKVCPTLLGDVVLARKDIMTSYHLSVVVDDAKQEITDIVRGEDLIDSTHIHVTLQVLLGYSTPRYHHHRLLTDANGVRLAKRNKSCSLRQLINDGFSREAILERIGPLSL